MSIWVSRSTKRDLF